MDLKQLATAERKHKHPYLAGNFAPVQRVYPLTTCSYSGTIPDELAGGEYVRNGGNPVSNEVEARDAHWFDGDGMLSGVLFRRTETGTLQPEFANQYILTDVYLSSISSPNLETPILPSITTLVNPLSSLLNIIFKVIRTLILVFLSHLPGSKQAIRRISVANTSLLYHDGRALATCESGPPMRIALPGLETVDWFDGNTCKEAEPWLAKPSQEFGGQGIFKFMREWTTAHPRKDPVTNELMLFHSSFVPPFVNYSVVNPSHQPFGELTSEIEDRLFCASVPGIQTAKMMHDFGVSHSHTVIMNLPLSLDPLNLMKNLPVVAYDPTKRSRFGVFPRYRPQDVRWFETKACCIFHTANTWTTATVGGSPELDTELVNMLACRLTSASLVFSAGDIAAPQPLHPLSAQEEEEQCRLYYYQFELTKHNNDNTILHQWALSAIPFEFPSLRESAAMSAARFVYGCSVSGATFGAALGRAVKINALVKMDVEALIARGKHNPPTQVVGCVDRRTVDGVIASKDPNDPIQIFKMPEGWYAQESRFVPRKDASSEDDGWILSYVFDESQLAENGECRHNAKSELWVIDAKNMRDIVARIYLPQRVPYGMHGNWFSEQEILEQRPVERLRSIPMSYKPVLSDSLVWNLWMSARRTIETFIQ